jgi:hypothetical protein
MPKRKKDEPLSNQIYDPNLRRTSDLPAQTASVSRGPGSTPAGPGRRISLARYVGNVAVLECAPTPA